MPLVHLATSYCLHLLPSSTTQDPQITVTILPVRPSPIRSTPSTPSAAALPPPVASDILLGKVPVSPGDLEWVEGGLILREPGEGGERGWFCRVERYWWIEKDLIGYTTPGPSLVGLGFSAPAGEEADKVKMQTDGDAVADGPAKTGEQPFDSRVESKTGPAPTGNVATGIDGVHADGEAKRPNAEVEAKAPAGTQADVPGTSGGVAPDVTMT